MKVRISTAKRPYKENEALFNGVFNGHLWDHIEVQLHWGILRYWSAVVHGCAWWWWWWGVSSSDLDQKPESERKSEVAVNIWLLCELPELCGSSAFTSWGNPPVLVFSVHSHVVSPQASLWNRIASWTWTASVTTLVTTGRKRSRSVGPTLSHLSSSSQPVSSCFPHGRGF